MGMTVTDLINYLRLEGPCDHAVLPITSEEDTPPHEDESSMREKLLIGKRTPRGTLVRGRESTLRKRNPMRVRRNQ